MVGPYPRSMSRRKIALTRIGDSARHEMLHLVREALSNIARHSRASRAHLQVDAVGDELRLEVRDNGVGFDPAAVASERHHGLVNMRERATAAGGRMEIDSRPGVGTQIVVHIPFEDEGPPT